jgi:hypothetical protein
MGLFKKMPYSAKNLMKGVAAARAAGQPLSGYRYAVAFQQEEDERAGRTWSKVKMSQDHDSGEFQTDNYIGVVGEGRSKRKVHVAVNSDGDVVFVRDFDQTVLYDRKNGVGYLPPDLDWSK